jgi:hypothetical protein
MSDTVSARRYGTTFSGPRESSALAISHDQMIR